MNLDQITTKCWILALFIRDDGERLLLGDGWFDFKDSLQHFQPNNIANDIVELQGTDGQLLAGQVRRSASQSFDGYVGDALTSKTEIENRRRQFIQFFRTRRHYKVIYIFPDGTAIQRRMGYLTDAPSVPEMWQKFPEYHVALNFEDVNYYEYAEDAQGDEIYAHDSLVKLISVQSGGLIWDGIGAVSHGYTWLDPQTVTGDYITVTDGATGSPLTLSQLTGNAEQTTYSGKNKLNYLDVVPATDQTTMSFIDNGFRSVTTATGYATKITLSVKPSTTYALSWILKKVSGTMTPFVRVYEGTGTSTVLMAIQSATDGSYYGSFTTASGVTQVNIWFYNGTPAQGTTDWTFIQLEESATKTDYEPYTGGASPNPDYPQDIQVVTGEQTIKITGKNLANLEPDTSLPMSSAPVTVLDFGEDRTVTETTSFIFSDAKYANISGALIDYQKADGTHQYRTAGNFEDSDNNSLTSKVNSVFSGTYTNTTTITFCKANLYLASNYSGWSQGKVSVQIELGPSASEFEPYQGQEFTIDLGSIELAGVGEIQSDGLPKYRDTIKPIDGKWYIEKQVGKAVFDGSENWDGYLYGGVFRGRIVIDDIKDISANADFVGMSDYFYVDVGVLGSATIRVGMFCQYMQTKNVYFGASSSMTTLNEWKTWLSTHNTTVYYALATPTTTEITDETLLAQLNFIASLYGGVNNISLVPSAGAQGEMTLNYYADVDTTGAGYEWEAGEGGGPTIVQVIGVDNAQPIWTVTGPATNPTLTDITTVQSITWNGTVPNGQKLIVDMANQTATLAGANVYEFITGSWITLRPGANKLTYSAQGADQASQIQWNGVIG